MKRSEMIEVMAGQWLEMGFDEELVPFEEEAREELEYRMSKLLAFLEHQGMKPPLISIDPVLYTVKHVWENEDDKT